MHRLTLLQYECAAYVIDTWVDSAAQGRSNIDPRKIPWEMIRALIIETYGGKIDDEGDFRELDTLVSSSMVPQAFEEDHQLVESTDPDWSLTVPSGTSLAALTEWVRQLPEREPPTFLGLPANAEKLLLVDQGNTMIKNLARVAEVLDEGERVLAAAATEA